MTNAERVLAFLLSISPNSATNGKIVSRTGIKPHQQVFQITRKLFENGQIEGRLFGKEWEFWASKPASASPNSAIELQAIDAVAPLAESIPTSHPRKLSLPVATLVESGFALSGCWTINDQGDLSLDRPAPREPGVYAFAKDNTVVYVGAATTGLSKRLYSYRRPGPTQLTNQRLNKIIKGELHNKQIVEIYTSIPPDLDWNGLPVNGIAGLEFGLIKAFHLPWNIRSA